MTEHKTEDCLTLLNDCVLDPKKDSDAFNHGVYAQVLAKIFKPNSGNKYGISVALFGKWGQGKSSVVEMLKNELAKDKIKVVVFNAWQSRGDSVRRQLFLEVLEAINKSEATKMKRFAGLEVARELLQTENDKCESVKHARHKLLKSLREDQLLGWAFVVLLFLLILPAYNLTNYFICGTQINWAGTLSQTVITPALFFLFKYVRETVVAKYTGLLGISEPISESQRLKYPEQFKDLFIKHTAIFSREHDLELLVVLDDLDRCEPETVVEALASIRQLSGGQKYTPRDGDKYHGEELPMRCRFLIPCDDKQVVLALETDGYFAGRDGASYHDYQNEELLRKFFDVVVRMDGFIPEDMVSYAGKMLKSANILSDKDVGMVQELIGAIAPRDPRQVKKLVNAYLVFKAKLNVIQASKRFRMENTLSCFDKTLLFVIALQETVPDVFEQLVESSSLLQQLRFSTTIQSIPNGKQKTASQILRALEPVSETTFRLLTRKGLPETLLTVNNGPELYDAVLAGNDESFATEIVKTDNLNDFIVWLKEHRRAMHGTAQFRNALSCLIKPQDISDLLLIAIEDYLKFPELKDALKSYEGIFRLAALGAGDRLGSGRAILKSAIIDNFNDLKDADMLMSNELKALFILVGPNSNLDQEPFLTKIIPQLKTSDQKTASEKLTALRTAMPENYTGAASALSLTIASECAWSIYNTSEPDKNKGLHSDLIAAFIGEDAVTSAKIVDLLFKPKGPLETVINLTNSGSQKGEREALRTLAKIAQNLLPADIPKLYEKLIPWVNSQSDMGDFKFVCDILRTVWPRLSEPQIDAFVKLLTERCNTAKDAEWLNSLAESRECRTDTETQRAARFCKKVLTRLNELKLKNNTFDDPAKKLLKGMADGRWPIAEEADSIFADAIKSNRIGDKATWDVWASSLWPLVEHHHPLMEQAIFEKIQNNFLPETLIPFAVEHICKKKLSSSLSIAIKQYFCAHPSSANNKALKDVLNALDVEGADRICDLIVEDLTSRKVTFDEPRVEFLAKNVGLASEEARNLLMNFIRIQYLQDASQANFFKGMNYVHSIGSPSDDIVAGIKERALELKASLTDEQRKAITDVLGEDIFMKATPNAK